MSGAQTSPFPNQNELMQANAQQLANYYAPERNRLFVQQATQEAGARDMEAVARASSGLLTLGDETQMAAAYPETVRYLQSQGFARNAPLAFPGKAALERMVSLSIPAEKQYQMAGTAGSVDAYNASLGIGGPPRAPAATGGPAAPAGDGVIPPAPELAPIVAPGGAKFSVAAPYAERFQGLVNDLEAAGYKLDPGTSGGYNPRVIAGTNTPSQHSYGAAVDLNSARNARGSQGDIPAELARALAAKWGLTWGGDWEGNTRDPMHFEVAAANRGAAPVRGVAARTGGTDVASAGTTAAPQLAAPALINPLSSPAAVASIGAPPAPGSVAAQTAGLVVPQGATPQPGVAAPAQAPAATPAPVAPAPAPTAPTPAPGAPAAVLPPLPPAPPPMDPRTKLTADDVKQLAPIADAVKKGLYPFAQYQNDVQQRQTANIAANDKYEAAVYARQEKAKADQNAAQAAAIQAAQEKRAQDEAARKAAQKVHGDALTAQHENTLLTGDPKSPEYKSAYEQMAAPKIIDGVIFKPPMRSYRLPQEEDGTPITTYGELQLTFGPGDVDKIRTAFVEGNSLKAALRDFSEVSQKATAAERAWAATGGAGELNSAWTNVALLAKGEALYKLGVLSGPDLTIIRNAVADPSTVRGWLASHETTQKQIDRITRIINDRLDEVRKVYGPGVSGLPTTSGQAGRTGGTSAPPIPPPPAGFTVAP